MVGKSAAYYELKDKLKGRVLSREPLSKHTSWRIGGPADILALPRDIDDLCLALSYASEKQIPVQIMGNGTNLLVSDLGVRGIVVKIGPGLAQIRVQNKDNCITAGAGVPLPKLAARALQSSLAGFEFLAGIPGTVGGALVMNAGANGYVVGELVKQVLTVDYQGQKRFFNNLELDFFYRGSSLARQDLIVAEVVFNARPGSAEQIKQKTAKFLARRRQSQPLEYPNAGSVFKNPPDGSAGWLIEQAGCKGMRVGSIEVSTRHANFFVNLGGGTARDVLTLVKQVQQRVQDQFGCLLELEVFQLGEF